MVKIIKSGIFHDGNIKRNSDFFVHKALQEHAHDYLHIVNDCFCILRQGNRVITLDITWLTEPKTETIHSFIKYLPGTSQTPGTLSAVNIERYIKKQPHWT